MCRQPAMTMVDVLCPDCCVPMLTLNGAQLGFLACGNCQTVWQLRKLDHREINWETGGLKSAPIRDEDITSAFATAMSAPPTRPRKART